MLGDKWILCMMWRKWYVTMTHFLLKLRPTFVKWIIYIKSVKSAVPGCLGSLYDFLWGEFFNDDAKMLLEVLLTFNALCYQIFLAKTIKGTGVTTYIITMGCTAAICISCSYHG